MTLESIPDPAVRAAFEACSPRLREPLLRLRGFILATAAETPGVGALVESLKWGEPAYRPKAPRMGTTIRINPVKGSDDRYAAYFHCQTSLVETFRLLYPDDFVFEGDRAILFRAGDEIADAPLRHCIALALTYHASKKVSG